MNHTFGQANRGWRIYIYKCIVVVLLTLYTPLGWAATPPPLAGILWPTLQPGIVGEPSSINRCGYIRWIPQEQLLQGDLQLQVSTNLPALDFQVNLEASVWQMVWDQATRSYQELPNSIITAYTNQVHLSLANSLISLPFELQLPPEPGFWRVVFTVSLAATPATPATPTTLATPAAPATPSVPLPPAFYEEFASQHTYYVAYYPPAPPIPSHEFTIAVLPDTQYYARDYPIIFIRQTQWLAENAQSQNISLALHMGDITSRNTPAEWETAVNSLGLLWETVPCILSVGNHDIVGPAGYMRQQTLVDNYFPAATFPYLAGAFEPNQISNSYHLLQLADQPYLVLSLEFGPRDEVLKWADQVISAYPDRKVIIITHTYTGPGGVRICAANSTASPQFYLPEPTNGSVNDGAQMWDKLIRHHANIQLVLSGHIGVSAITYNIARADHDNLVYELLTDYQWEANGGNGYLALLKLTPAGELIVQAYSPYLDEYKTGKDRPGFSNQFIIHLESGEVRPCIESISCI